MGQTISRLRLAIKEFKEILSSYSEIAARIRLPAEPPCKNPTQPYWSIPPSPIANHKSTLPDGDVDIVIIGSGITGASVARGILHTHGVSVTVVMIEARELCSGATGRNGGHLNPNTYSEYGQLKADFGIDMAQKMIRFRLQHANDIHQVAKEDDILDASELRVINANDVYYDSSLWDNAKSQFKLFEEEMPEEASQYTLHEGAEALKKFKLASGAVGCIQHSTGGAMHPYRFVTGIIARLLVRYPKNFFLSTSTECVLISIKDHHDTYTVYTKSRQITAKHVVHATNAYASNLVDGIVEKIVPCRATMTAQRPGTNLGLLNAAYVFYDDGGSFDYLTQLPHSGIMMLGGAWAGNMDEIARSDDDAYDKKTSISLSGALPVHFGEENWGAESQSSDPNPEANLFKGRVLSIWSGIIGVSADGIPWVGRIPKWMSERPSPVVSEKDSESGLLSLPGEWISAGYSGEGMVHAWLSGRALATMIVKGEDSPNVYEELPEITKITKLRWKTAKIENLMERY